MNPETHRNGCNNRYPLVHAYPVTKDGPPIYIKSFSAGKPCEYTKSALGQADKGCTDCKHRRNP